MPVSPPELRHQPRALLVAGPDFRPQRAVVADASPRGLGLVLGEPVAAGADAAVALPGLVRAGGWHAGRVAHCTARPDGTWLAGLALRATLSPAELEALRDRGTTPGGEGTGPTRTPETGSPLPA